MAKLWSFVKACFYIVIIILCLAVVTYFILEAVMPEEEFCVIKEWIKVQYENFLDFYDNAKFWVINKFEEVKKNFIKEEIPIEGMKLSEIGNYEMSKYIDVTIPYNFMVSSMNNKESQAEETVVIYCDNIMVIMYLKDDKLLSDAPSINRYRKEMIKFLSSQYPDYDFGYGDVIDNKVGIINVTTSDETSKMYVAVAGLGDKTLVINFIYNADAEEEAENYFRVILNEISVSLK